MNQRIKHLREKSLDKKASLSTERAELLTRFYQSGKADRVSIPVARAMAFRYLLDNKTIFIDVKELIVGERGPEPKATPTYPEICTHTLNDLDILNSRAKINFSVSDADKQIYRDEIIPFWRGRCIRDRLFEQMDKKWLDAFYAGVFTEFMEQRAPGHTVLGDKIYKKGLREIIKEISAARKNLDFFNDPTAFYKREELTAMKIAAEALIAFANRYAKQAERMSEKEGDAKRKKELQRIAENCRQVPESAPASFWQALQYYWFIHLGVITELNTWDSFNPGRLDQHLYPFYQYDVENKIHSKEEIKELLQAFWIKFNNQPAPPKVGVTAIESNTYTDFCLINLGGIKADGSNAVNELSYIILDVIKEMRLLQPSSMVQISKKTPDRFLKKALEIIKTGFGQPSIFNTDAIVQELIRQGKTLVDARNGGASGCVEAGAFGKESYILTGYFNLTKVLEITLHNGIDTNTNQRIGLATGDPRNFKTFDQLLAAFTKQLRNFIDIKIKGNAIVEQLYAHYLPVPFLSLLIDDCIQSGKDYHTGGARYNTLYIQGVGLGSVTDSLTALKFHIYDRKTLSMDKLLTLLDNNFKNFESERQMLKNNTPKYGNDDDYADSVMKQIFENYFNAVDGRPGTKGSTYRINLLPTTVHVYFGNVTTATPDGRKAGEPLSEGISPVQGMDRNGPTAVLKSAGKIDHLRTGGTLLNQKFTPGLLKNNADINKICYLIRSYFSMEGHHLQFNVVSADTLRKAQSNPDKYGNLIVRVAGYSDYFIDLSTALQNEIIKRTEHMNL
ncbi:formate C-acetyltransferase/glycerol dehydratase family glycyl radical enzyme [candidate division KSB1 bacterium]|nr:formate C-acetyltransferase/glycerol dehydratase family glycyl radical enzyme [candidate division KSB1 bacterium]